MFKSIKLGLLNYAFLFGLIIKAQTEQAASEKLVEVILGIDKIVQLDFSWDSRIQVGDDSVLELKQIPQRREIVFRGIKSGRTSVVIRDSVGNIKARFLVRVTATSQSKIVQELRDFIGDVEGIEIGIKSGVVYVGGKIIVPEDIGRVVTIIKQNKFRNVLFLVELSRQTQELIARKMQEEIQRNQLKDVTVRLVNGLFWLEGIVSSDEEKNLAEQVAKAFFPAQIPSLAERTDAVKTAVKAPIQNFIFVNKKKPPPSIPKLIKVTAQFVELTKDYAKTFGFKWQPLLAPGEGSISIGRRAGGEIGTNSTNTLAATISNLFPKLYSLKNAGYARVLQSGVLFVKDKTEGTINKSEVIPFSLGSGEFTKSEKAQSGFTLRVKPTLLPQDKIDLNMGLDVKATFGNPPHELTNSVSTAIITKSKESAVIGGIVFDKNTTNFDRDPLPPGVAESSTEGSSPLFSFIRSKAFTVSKTQFVVFVTPEIVESAAQDSLEIRRKFRYRGR